MKSTVILLLLTINLLSLLGCKDKIQPNGQSFHRITQENELNQFRLEFTSSNSVMESNKTINFTSDTIIVQLKIDEHEGEGTVEINLYQGDSTAVRTFSCTGDTLLTDTLINVLPDKVTINLWKFTGSFGFQMNGK